MKWAADFDVSGSGFLRMFQAYYEVADKSLAL
jgi:hypothetical protein